jgi:DNA-directed RNA polymerase specialized sigma24 family protein
MDENVSEDIAMMDQRHWKHDVVCETFCSHLQHLHLEAHVLTGCPNIAADCVIEAFSAVLDSYLASPTFAYQAAKLATIKIGLSKIAPDVLRLASSEAKRAPDDNPGKNAFSAVPLDTIIRERLLISLLQLNPLHRALLVLRLYERYRIHDVALLLRLSPATVKRWLPDAISTMAASIQDATITGGVLSSTSPLPTIERASTKRHIDSQQ